METTTGADRNNHGLEVAIALIASAGLVLGLWAFGTALADGDEQSAPATDGVEEAAPAIEPVAQTGAEHGHDEAAVAVDDRGFSKLENGEEHAHTFVQAVSDADRIELARQLALTREVALQYPTVADAEAAGLHRAGPFSPGLGAHYVSYGNALANDDGVMSDDDIRGPLAWIYDGTHQDSRVVGLFYMSGKADAEGFAGPNDVWHFHEDVCIKQGADGVIDAPLGADHNATPEQCAAVGGNLLEQTQYLLHVWTVPGWESPEGVFSHLSSAVTCDDGSYETIADVTKVGTATTMCLDGSE